MDSIRDISKRIADIIEDDDSFERKFDRNPAKAIEEVLGIDLPDEKLNRVVSMVKEMLHRDKGDFDDPIDKAVSKIGKLLD